MPILICAFNYYDLNQILIKVLFISSPSLTKRQYGQFFLVVIKEKIKYELMTTINNHNILNINKII